MWYFAILSLALIDIAATHYQVNLWGYGVEGNPIQKWIMINIGMWASYVFRLILPLIGLRVLLWLRDTYSQYYYIISTVLWLVLIFHLWIVYRHATLTDWFTIHAKQW